SVDHVNEGVAPTPSTVPASISTAPPTIVRTTVAGTLHNDSPAAIVVDPFPVDVTFVDAADGTARTITATAHVSPATVAPGASVPWSVTIDNATPDRPHRPPTARAKLGTWHWSDPALATACRP